MWRTVRVLFILVTTLTLSYGQKGTHSPYSIFGLGELKMNDYAAFLSMGGVSMANIDSTMVNPGNPGSYSYMDRHKPIFQLGMNGRFSEFKTTTSKSNQRHFGLNQFQLGVPIKKRWGAALGLKPYSFTGYFISNYIVEDDDSTEIYTNEGSGGISKFFVGVAYRGLELKSETSRTVWRKDSTKTKYLDTIKVSRSHDLSIGANANYLFGSSKRIRSFQFSSSASGLNSKVNNSLRFSDLIYDFGLNYQFKWSSSSVNGGFNKGNSIAIGATYSPAIRVRSYQDLFSYSYINSGGFNGAEIFSDTIESITDNQGKVYVPESYKAGIEFRFGPKSTVSSSLLRIGLDARYQKWSKYKEDFGSTYTNELRDRLQLGLGLEWTPVSIPYGPRTPYLGQVHYRLGFDYVVSEVQIETSLNNYTGLSSYGMSFGLGLPISIKNSNTNINFGANLGMLGTTDYGLIQERYIGVFVGLSITPGNGDLWFLKRKYD